MFVSLLLNCSIYVFNVSAFFHYIRIYTWNDSTYTDEPTLIRLLSFNFGTLKYTLKAPDSF